MNKRTRSLSMLSVVTLVAASLSLPASAHDKRYRPDPWITLKTKIALLTAEGQDAIRVNVDTINGRVTLHGKVESAADKARAERIAKQIEGTNQVRNLLQIVPEKNKKITNLEDKVAHERVEQALKSDPALANSRIRVQSVNKGVVLLSGTASSLSDHLRAIEDVASVEGVRHVSSEIQSPDTLSDRDVWADSDKDSKEDAATDRGLKQTVSDMWITTAAKMRLMADSETPATEINVDTENGVVTLFGVVPTEESKRAAEADAQKVSGVKKVNNALQVVPEEKQKAGEVRDEEALNAAKESLKGRDEFKDVSVEVKNGVARLTGMVPSTGDRLMAAVVVRSNKGIRSVDNGLKVKE